MEKTFLYIDQLAINKKLNSVKTTIQIISKYFVKYNEIAGLPPMITEDLVNFIKTPRSFFIKILTNGETLKIGSLDLDTTKVYDLLANKPIEVENLVKELDSLNSDYLTVNNYFGELKFIEIKNGNLEVSSDYVEELNNTFTYYTESEDQQEALTIMNEVAAKLSELKQLQKKGFYYNEGTWIDHLFKVQSDYKTVKANIPEVRKF